MIKKALGLLPLANPAQARMKATAFIAASGIVLASAFCFHSYPINNDEQLKIVLSKEFKSGLTESYTSLEKEELNEMTFDTFSSMENLGLLNVEPIVYENQTTSSNNLSIAHIYSETDGEVVLINEQNLGSLAQKEKAPSVKSTNEKREKTNTAVAKESSSAQPVTVDANGIPLNYAYTIEGKGTAYTGGSFTATGTVPKVGSVAVNPKQIPYGTEMYIVSRDGKYVYGHCVAEDTGGFVKWNNGRIVDLYMNSYDECMLFGVRDVIVYILN